MSKFIFIKKPSHVGDETTVKVTVVAESLTTIIGAFEEFVKGCGYFLPRGASIGYEYSEEERRAAED